jgi:hypothetical protein
MKLEYIMKRRTRALILFAIVALITALAPATILAQETTEGEDGLLLRINNPVTLAESEAEQNVVVIGDNATIDGTVTGSLFVLNGDATVTGQVEQDIVVVRGTLDLASTATVGDVSVIRGNLVRDAGATVNGSITEGDFQVNFWDWGIFWAFLWLGATLVTLVAGLVFAAIGGRQLKAAGDAAIREIGPTLLGAAAAWIVLPILMVMIFITLVGIPLSLGYLLFVLPAIWFLGYLVAGTQLGRMILRSRYDEAHPYLAALLGLIILQIVGILPVFGGLITTLAGIVGSGALIVLAWRAWRGSGTEQNALQVQVTTPKPAS